MLASVHLPWLVATLSYVLSISTVYPPCSFCYSLLVWAITVVPLYVKVRAPGCKQTLKTRHFQMLMHWYPLLHEPIKCGNKRKHNCGMCIVQVFEYPNKVTPVHCQLLSMRMEIFCFGVVWHQMSRNRTVTAKGGVTKNWPPKLFHLHLPQ